MSDSHISEDYRRDLEDRISTGIFHFSSDLKAVHCNRSMAALLGYSNPEALMTQDGGVQDWFFSQADGHLMIETLRTKGAVEPFETRFLKQDGDGVWVSLTVLPISFQKGETLVYEGHVTDITRTKQMMNISSILVAISHAVSTTRDLNHLYRSIHDILNSVVDIANFFIAIVDEVGDRLLFPYYEDERDEMWDIGNISDPETKCLTLNVIRSGKPLFTTRQEIQGSDLSVVGPVPEVWIGAPLKIRDKTIGAMAIQHYTDPHHYTADDVNIMTSVSEQVALAIERKMNEEALRDSELRMKTILDSIQAGIFLIELNTRRIIDINPAAAALIGSPKEDIVGHVCQDFLCNFEKTACPLTGTNGEMNQSEQILIRANGEELPVLKTVKQILLDGKKHLVESFIDVSEIKRLESQLYHAQRMETVGKLAGGIAHDINNLLMGIQGRASIMLLDRDPSHADYEHLKSIEECVKNGSDLTQQILGYSRGGKYEVKSTGIQPLINKTLQMFERTTKDIIVHRDFPARDSFVDVDKGQMGQVLMNLLVNARQAMPQGGDIHIRTEAIELDDPAARPLRVQTGRYVKISVADNGIGMDSTTLEKVFDPFFTTKKIQRGTGMGLASAYGIVRNHNGAISVSSRKGQGTTFTVHLPESKPQVDPRPVAIDPVSGREKSILLVDDEKMVAEVCARMLESMGYHVICASSGQEAVEFYRTHLERIEVVILDMIMPGMSGGETFDRLKEINPAARVILSSGYTLDGEASEIMDRGCDGFIQKPFGMDVLSSKIGEIVA